MKILKYLLLLVLLIVIGGLIYVSTQSNDYDVKRNKLIKAPASVIFNNVNEFKNWQTWGPWMEEDPTILASYPNQTSGVGASYTWTSKDGPGKMETIALEEHQSLTQKITFGDYEPTDVYWVFDKTNKGTNVTWGMKAEKTPFMFKIFAALSGGMENMLGPMLEKGLNNLDNIITEEMIKNPPKPKPTFKLGEIKTQEVDEQHFIGYPLKSKTEHEAMTKLFMEYLPKAGQHAMEQKLSYEEMTPGAVFTNWDEKTGEAEFYIGLLIKKKVPLANGMENVTLTSGKNIMISKYGNYGTGDAEAHQAIDTYLKANSLEQNGPIWELYVNDPTKVKPEEIQTDIFYPIK